MAKFLNRFMYIVLILLITFLILDFFFIIQFSYIHKNIVVFLTFLFIIFTSYKDLIIGKGVNKFLGIVTLFCTVFGCISSILNNQIHLFIYICLLFALINSVVTLVYSKA